MSFLSVLHRELVMVVSADHSSALHSCILTCPVQTPTSLYHRLPRTHFFTKQLGISCK